MAKLNESFFNKIAAKIIETGEPDDLAKFMLSGEEPIEAVQRYFEDLEIDKKQEVTLRGDEWFLTKDDWTDYGKNHTGLSLFKLIIPSIIPHVKKLRLINTKLDDYSFLKDIKNLDVLELEFADEKEHTKVLAGLSSLESVSSLFLIIKGLNLQLLCLLSFSFNYLFAERFVFETNPKCDKVFPTQEVYLCGDEELMNNFVFTRQNYQNYIDIFPETTTSNFRFFIKISDDINDLLKVSSANYADQVEFANRTMEIDYRFFNYSGYSDSKILKKLQDGVRWNTENCPYGDAVIQNEHVYVSCNFPSAIAEVGKRLAEKSLRRIPEGSNYNPEEYYRLTIENPWGHKTDFDVLKNFLLKDLLKAYYEIAGMDRVLLFFEVVNRWVLTDETVADYFKDGDIVSIILINMPF